MVKIYQTFLMGEAQYKIHLTERKEQADLWVYIVGNQGMSGKNGLWYLTENFAESSAKVFFCAKGMSELSVCFVKNRSEAGWQTGHRFSMLL